MSEQAFGGASAQMSLRLVLQSYAVRERLEDERTWRATSTTKTETVERKMRFQTRLESRLVESSTQKPRFQIDIQEVDWV